MALNHIEIHGRLGRDPELKEYSGQNGPWKKATFTVAVNRDFGDETDWFFCSVKGKRAEVVEKYFRKGSEIIVQGRMESYKPKGDDKRTSWVLEVEKFDFCGSKSDGSASRRAPEEGMPQPDSFEQIEEEIPF